MFISSLMPSSISAGGKSGINSKQCGISEPVGRVINGSAISKLQVPWMVTAIMYRKGGKAFLCGGSIITRNVILTAAHCIEHEEALEPSEVYRIDVHYNTTRLQQGPFIRVKYGVSHKKYEPFAAILGYDIGLMKLEKPLPKYDRFVRPVCLPKQGQKTKPGSMLFAGHGRTGYKKPQSEILLSYTPRVLKDKDCRTAMAQQWRVKHGKNIPVICTRHPNSMAYEGDSGGPLTASMKNGRSTQFGIASVATENSNAGPAPVVFTRVAYFRKWIERALKNIKHWKRLYN